MKTLIISMTCGEGHNYIAKAIKSELDLLNEDCKIIQLYGYSDKEVQRQNKLFLNTCKYIPSLYEKIWLKLRSRNPKRPSSIVKKTIKSCDKYLLSEIEKYNPDNIICTHNNASAVISYFKKENKIPAHIKTYTIAFDYCVCPYWEFSTDCDYIITPHEFTHNEYLEKGFNSAQLLPFGLPVDEKYTKSINKQQARETLGINPEIFTVALYSGGNCLSKASKFITIFLSCIAAYGMNMDYYFAGILLILAFYYFRENRLYRIISVCLFNLYLSQPAGIISLFFIELYNGKKGANIKYLLYAFYPVHFVVLFIIRLLMRGTA